MRMPASTAVAAVVLALASVGCTAEEGTQGTTLEGARDAQDIVQHLVEPPSYPAPVSSEPVLAELRSADGNNRHHAFLADLSGVGTLEGDLERGALVQVLDGATLTAPDGASTASLDGAALGEVADCDAACEVQGPALVAPPEWLPGIGAAAGWELVVPAPES